MRFADLPRAIDRCGPAGALVLFTARRRLRRWLPKHATVRISGVQFPLVFRRVSTDRYVLAEVLLNDQYSCLAGLSDVRTIVDLGANIGAASVFLLSTYRSADLIAVEPDPGNFEVLLKNLAPYGPRARAINAAVWSRTEALVVDRGHFRDGGEWSFQVTDRDIPDAPKVAAYSLEDLWKLLGLVEVDVLKIDVEGAERVLMPAALGEVLKRVRTLAIELHDGEAHQKFAEMMIGLGGRLSRHGEVNVWTRDAPVSSDHVTS